MQPFVPFSDVGRQFDLIAPSLKNEVELLLQSRQFILSSKVKAFEKAFAEFCEADHCVGVNSGTDALMLVMKALEIGQGDEVILPVNTFIATAEAVHHTGATSIFADILDTTKSIDPADVSRKITRRTKAVIAVHLFGNPAPMQELLDLANQHQIDLLEDACQAHGAKYQGRPVGSFGSATAFSFYPGKNLGGMGDGGAVVTNRQDLAIRVRMLSNHGGLERYRHDYIGFNSRLDSIQAVVLLLKLKYLSSWNDRRRHLSNRYRELLSPITWLKPLVPTDGACPVYHLFPVEITDDSISRNSLAKHLKKNGIEIGIHYPEPLHLTKAFRHLGHIKGSFPVAEKTMRNHLSLPIHPSLTEEMIRHVVTAIRDFAD